MQTQTRKLMLFLLLTAMLGAHVGAQSIWYVQEGATGNGTENSPFGTIQAAMNAASSGDTVLVEPGLYQENVSFAGKDIILQSRDGADQTTIDGGRNGTTVSFPAGCTNKATIRGFKITGGLGGSWVGGAIDVQDASASIYNCRIEDNNNDYTGGHGATLFVQASTAPVYMINCLIRNNAGLGRGTVAYAASGSEIRIAHCVAIENSAGSIYTAGLLLNANSSTDKIECINSVFYRNNLDADPNRGDVTLNHCFKDYFYSVTGTDNIQSFNPDFEDGFGTYAPLDLHPRETSPLIDAGTLDFPWTPPTMDWLDFEGNRRLQGRSDLGIYETTYTPKSVNVPADYPTIQDAIQAAWHGDTIAVSPGTWPGFLWYTDKRVKIKSTNGPSVTFIDGNLPYSNLSLVEIVGVLGRPDYGHEISLQGFTIQNADGPLSSRQAGGIHIESASALIEHCIIRNCKKQLRTRAISVATAGHDVKPLFRSCQIVENSATGESNEASLLLVYRNSPVVGVASAHFQGCTIANNVEATTSDGMIRSTDGPMIFENCIIYGNTTPQLQHDPSSQITMEYCNVQGGFAGNGNINVDPLFLDDANGNYNLDSTSLCVNAGNPNFPTIGVEDIDGDPRRLCASIDIGADETIPVGNCSIVVGPGGYESIQVAIDASS